MALTEPKDQREACAIVRLHTTPQVRRPRSFRPYRFLLANLQGLL